MKFMKKKIKKREVIKFKKGDETHLDCIYEIQGLFGGDWWDKHDDMDDDVFITRDVHFELIEYESTGKM